MTRSVRLFGVSRPHEYFVSITGTRGECERTAPASVAAGHRLGRVSSATLLELLQRRRSLSPSNCPPGLSPRVSFPSFFFSPCFSFLSPGTHAVVGPSLLRHVHHTPRALRRQDRPLDRNAPGV